MNAVTPLPARANAARMGSAATVAKHLQTLDQHVIEIMSDSGEGAQKCGQSFGSIAARTGNGVWTVEIIPAEIQPPARSVAGASGNRIRIGSHQITNGGDEADIAVAFNEQVLLGRVNAGELKAGCIVLLENMWAEHDDAKIAGQYAETRDRLVAEGYRVYEVPMETECRALVPDPRKGKNMFVLGMLCNIYSLDMNLARDQVAFIFGKKDAKVIASNVALLEAGWQWAESNLDFKYRVPAVKATAPQVVINGNTAIALGVLASGMDICAMYPITPATSASHYLSDVFERAGGIVHQAEDEIAACAFAIGASYTGKVAVTITSGPGYSLKQEGLGLAVMAEIPLVVVNVQRGGPSTGQPTKVEQGDLLTVMFGSHGDAPKVVMAPGTIEDCFYSMITARRLAEDLQHGRRRAVGCKPRDGAATFSAPAILHGMACASGRPEPGSGRRKTLRLGSGHRSQPALRAGAAERHAHADRSRARSQQSCRLRPGDQRAGNACAQHEARDAAEDPHAASGVWRPRGRAARGRLGRHQGRHRGSRGAVTRRRSPRLLHAPDVPATDAARHR